MLSLRTIAAAVLGSCLLTVGCMAEPTDDEGPIAEVQQEYIWINGIDPDFGWLPDVFGTIVWYSHHRLANASGELPPSILLSTAKGRDLMAHLIGCAMPAGTVIKNSAAGFAAEGALGLAANWKNVPLDWVAGQRAVTSCYLQSLNAFNVQVKLNLTGYTVPPTEEDVSSFDFPDMITFGNIFGANPTAYACWLKPLEKACGFGTSASAKQRICDTSPTCKLTLLGACNAGVCDVDEKGNSKCYSPTSEAYTESIMSSLRTDEVRRLYPECSP